MSGRTREQERARHAYSCASKVPVAEQQDYKALADGFGAFVLKNGLVAALAFVQRNSGVAKTRFLNDLAAAHVPGLEGKSGEGLFAKVRDLDVAGYMLATRELLAVALWMRRAAQATFDKKQGAGDAQPAK